jgi:2-haloacid dehalogenase
MTLDFRAFSALTFDCYGTLIDWESGLLGALMPFLHSHGVTDPPEAVLPLYARLESAAEHGPFKPYKAILEQCMEGVAAHYGIEPQTDGRDLLVRSLADWRPFPDTVEALKRLKAHYRLCIVSNIDEDLIRHSLGWLQVPFDEVVTAGQVGSYKPASVHFFEAQKRLRLPKESILHVAQSLYHDIAPTGALGIKNVWVNRRRGKAGSGATPESSAKPDLEVGSLGELADLVEKT